MFDIQLLLRYLREVENQANITDLEIKELKFYLKEKGNYRNINPFITELNKIKNDSESDINKMKITLIRTLLKIYKIEAN